ncbi:MAG: NAD-dependent epimerase/dehydratase family protein [Actinobacteria bacterium]|nr:NAD-dependent epimerase/dehydratase family protein [Actinomycetota bacterium]
MSAPGHVVVTGAAGFIGSHLVDRLLAAGQAVVGIDSFTDYYDPALKEANLEGALAHPGFRLVRADLLSLLNGPSEVREALAGADVVYHLAAQAGVRSSWGRSFRVYTDDNVLATQIVLETCADLQVPRVVCASSSSVYGDVTEMPLREDGPCRPVSPYGVTKLACEHLCRLYAAGRGLHTVALRFFTVFGPRQRPDMAFNLFMQALHRGEPITVYGGGGQTRDFTYVDDIVAGILAAPAAPAGSVVNLGGGHRVSLLQALDALAEVTGTRPSIVHAEAQPGDARDTWASLETARELLGYAPATSLQEGLAAEWEWVLSTLRAC